RMKDMDAYIDLRATENLCEWNDLADERVAAYRRNYLGPVHLKQRCNHTKWAVIRYPNDAMAQLAKMSTERFEDYYFDACLFDYAKLSAAMRKLADRMERTDKVRITGRGTELELSIKGIPAVVLDGHINVPDGEVYTAPVRDSISGVVSFNTPIPYEGFVYTDIVLEFKAGKVVGARANDSARLNRLLDTDEGARYTGEFAFGVHPRIESPIGDILFDEKIHGSFHLTPGKCYDNASNGNVSAIHLDLICIQRPEYGGGEIYFDGELVRKDGLFVAEDLECLNPARLLG
ncbi:MAG TPA: aminopeptidase, partial [Spirochaetia bacterium]|nr:aminopeptidase [Spirochaetia bacterium]